MGERLGNARVLARSGLLGPRRPDKYLRMGLAVRPHGLTVPREIVVLAALPRNASGKVVKQQLPQ